MTKNPRNLEELRKDPRVASVSDERDNDDGVWAYLNPGWFNDEFDHGCRLIHEQTVGAVLSAMRTLKHRPSAIAIEA